MSLASYQAAPPRTKDVRVDAWQYKIYEDEFGVRHWRYRFAGLLLVCGQGRGRGSDLAGDGALDDEHAFPTCLTCIVVMIREEGR